MDRTAFDAVARVERNHWFFVARRRIIGALLGRHFQRGPDRKILDISTGTGATMNTLHPYGRVTGTEYVSDALSWCRTLALHTGSLVQSSATELPFASGSFDLVTAFDVLSTLPMTGPPPARYVVYSIKREHCFAPHQHSGSRN